MSSTFTSLYVEREPPGLQAHGVEQIADEAVHLLSPRASRAEQLLRSPGGHFLV